MFGMFKTKTSKIKADEFDFDDDLMFDFGDGPPKAPQSKREAITELGQEFLKGGAGYVTSEAFIRKQVDAAFPKGYGEVVDLASRGSDSVRSLYDTAGKQLKPALNDIKKITGKIVPNVDKLLPKSVKDRMEAFANSIETEYGGGSGGTDGRARREELFQSSLNEMFKIQIEQAATTNAHTNASNQISEVMSAARHGENIWQLDAIRRSSSIVEQYHSKGIIPFQRRTYELQMRQYMLAQEHLNSSKELTKLLTGELAAIRINSGLPDFVKLTNSERLQEHLRNKFMGAATEKLFGAGDDFLPKLMDRMAKSAESKIKDLGSMASMLTGTVTSGMAMAEGFGESPDPSKMVANGLGDYFLGGAADDFFAKYVTPQAKKLKGAQKLGNQLTYGVKNAGPLLNSYLNGDRKGDINSMLQGFAKKLPAAKGLGKEGTGIRGFLNGQYRDVRDGLTNGDYENEGFLSGPLGFLKENVNAELAVNNSLFSNTAANINAPAQFTHGGSRALTEIIPGFLARIHQELRILRTGNTDVDLLHYDLITGKFASSADLDKTLSKILFNEDIEKTKDNVDKDGKLKIKSVTGAIKDIITLINGDQLSPEQQRELSNVLIDRSIDKMPADKRFLTNPDTFKGKNKEIFNKLFSEYFADDEIASKQLDFGEAFSQIGSGTNINFETVQNLVNAGYGQQLTDMGIIKDGKIDYRAYAKILLNGREQSGEKPKSDIGSVINKLNAVAPKPSTNVAPDQSVFNGNAVLQPSTKPSAASVQDDYPDQRAEIRQEFHRTRNVNQTLAADLSPVIAVLEKQSVKTEMQTVVEMITSINKQLLEGLIVKGLVDGGKEGKRWYQKSIIGGLGDLLSGGLAMGKSATGALWESGKATTRVMGNVAGKALGIGKWGATKGFHAGASVIDKIGGDFFDIYLPGSNEAIMLSWKLKAKHYASSVDNKFIIRKPKDFKKLIEMGGSVVDLTKRTSDGFEVVCEVKDLVDSIAVKRNGVAIKLSAVVGTVFKTALKTGNAMLRGMGSIGNITAKLMSFAGKHIGNFLDGPADVYVPGETSPRLLAIVMRKGGYISRTSNKPITKLSEIDGDVLYNGEVVLSLDEIRKGLLDKNGKKLKVGVGKIGKLIGMAGNAISGGYKAIMKAAKMTGSFLMGGMGMAKDFLKGVFGEGIIVTSKRTISVLEEIKAILDERLPQRKRKLGDTDGDGDVENSVADLRAKRAAAKAEKAAAAAAGGGKAAGGLGIGGSLKAAWDKMSAKRAAEEAAEEEGDSLLSQAGDVADIADSLGGDGSPEGKESRTKRAGRYAKNKAKGAGRLAGRGIKGVGRGLWGATKAGARGLGSIARNIPGGKATAGIGIGLGALAAYDVSQDKSLAISEKNTAYSGIAGGMGGAAAGASAGALIGSVVPGIGTVIGGLVGGAIGGLSGGAIGEGLGSAYFNKSLDEMAQLRYLQYGFKVDDMRYTQAIHDLEGMMIKATTYKATGVTLDPSKISANEMSSLFGASVSNEANMNRWAQWMLMRFKPVYLAHANAIAKVKPGKTIRDIGNLSDGEKGNFLAALKVPNEVFNVLSSPVPEVPRLLADAAMANTFLTNLKLKYKPDGKTPVVAGATVAAVATKAGEAAVPQKAQANNAVGAISTPKPPSLGGTVFTATAGAGAAMVSSSVVSPLETILMKSYGLVDLEPNKVDALRALTEDVLGSITINQNKASFSGVSDYFYRKFSSTFGCDIDNQAHYEFFSKWFQYRFITTLTTAITALVKNGLKKEVINNLSSVSGRVAYDTANNIKATMCGGEMGNIPVWNLPFSPWPDYKTNGTLSSVDGNLAVLKNGLSVNTIKEVAATENAAKSKSAMSRIGDVFSSIGNKASDLWKQGTTAVSNAGSAIATGASNMVSNVGGALNSAGEAIKEAAYNAAGNIGYYGGTVGQHAGKGTGGDINALPEPKGPEGKWSSVKDLIMAVGKMTGVDPTLLAGVAAKESSFRWNVKADSSSATGLFQFIRSTWDSMLKQYGAKYGIKPGTSPKDPRANALMGAEYIRENSKAIQSVKPGALSSTDLYIAHFLGAGGARKFFKAPSNSIGATIFPDAAKSNPSVFYDNGRPRTLGEIYQIFNASLNKSMAKVGLGNGIGAPVADVPAVAPPSVPTKDMVAANPGGEPKGAAVVPQKAQAKAPGVTTAPPVPATQAKPMPATVPGPSAGVVSAPAVQQRTTQDNKLQQDAYAALSASAKTIADTLNASLAEHKTHTGLLRDIVSALGAKETKPSNASNSRDQFKSATPMSKAPVSMAKGAA